MEHWYYFNTIKRRLENKSLVCVTEGYQSLTTDLYRVQQIRIVYVFLNNIFYIIKSETRWFITWLPQSTRLVAHCVQIVIVLEVQTNTVLVFINSILICNDVNLVEVSIVY